MMCVNTLERGIAAPGPTTRTRESPGRQARNRRRVVRIAAPFALIIGCTADKPISTGGDSGTADSATGDAGTRDPPTQCTTASTALPTEIRFPWADDNGIFDPSLAHDPASGRLWLSHSSVSGTSPDAHISQYLAYSPDDGLTWCFQGVVAQAEEIPVQDRPEALAGAAETHWSHEVSAIAHDPGATDPNRRWVVIWHRYLSADGVRNFGYGWIALKAAATPEGLVSAAEQKLFSALGYYPDGREAYNNSVIGPPQVALSKPGEPGLDGAGTDLDGCIGYTEPGLVATNDALHALLLCSDLPNAPKMVLVKLDHTGETWSYTGQLLLPADAAALGSYASFSGGELYRYGGSQFVIASPVQQLATPSPHGQYQGCVTYEVNLDTAAITAAPAHPSIPGATQPTVILSGVCTYDQAASASGFLFGEAHMPNGTDPQFRLFLTGATPQGD